MKTNLFIMLIILGLAVQPARGQESETIKEGTIIKFLADATHSLTGTYRNLAKDPTNSLTRDVMNHNPILLEANVLFRVIDITPTTYKIVALPYSELSKKDKANGIVDKGLYYNYRSYEVSKDEFLAKAVRVEESERVAVGVLTLPFKFRPQNEKSFDSEFNMNTTLNVKLWRSLHWQLGAGIGGVELNSSNSGGIAANQEIKAHALTFLTGIMLQHKKVQAGLYIGWDHINNQRHYQWENNGKTWVSIGIGYQLFNTNLDRQTQNNKN